MPLNLRWPFVRRGAPSNRGTLPEVGQPPDDAQPVAEPQLQDIGSASYELRLADDEPVSETDADNSPS